MQHLIFVLLLISPAVLGHHDPYQPHDDQLQYDTGVYDTHIITNRTYHAPTNDSLTTILRYQELNRRMNHDSQHLSDSLAAEEREQAAARRHRALMKAIKNR